MSFAFDFFFGGWLVVGAEREERTRKQMFALLAASYHTTKDTQKTLRKLEAGRASLGATGEMVIHLVRRLPATGYIIYTDNNYFTMQSLFGTLAQK